MRSVVKYHGGKGKMAKWIVSLMPPHKVYVEPFGGGASVLLAKPIAKTEIYNDLDGDIYNLFRVIREQPGELAAMVSMTVFSRDEMNLAYEPTDNNLERARRLIVRSHMSISTTSINSKSGFRTAVNSKDFCSQFRTFSTLPEVIFKVRDRLANTAIENTDAFKLLDRYDLEETLWYFDPPYPKGTRSVKSNSSGYNHNMTDDAHLELLERIKLLKGKVMISSYENEIYRQELSEWRTEYKIAMDDAKNRKKEIIWMNFDDEKIFKRNSMAIIDENDYSNIGGLFS